MRRHLGPRVLTAALVAALAAGAGACGADEGGGDVTADDPSAPSTSSSPADDEDTATPSPTTTDAPSAESGDSVPRLVDLVSATSAGGEVSELLTSVGEPGDLARYLGQFDSADLVADLRDIVRRAQVPDGQDVAMAVVALGCDVPPGVGFESGPSGYTVVAQKVKSPLDTCFAPMTTVAVVQVPD